MQLQSNSRNVTRHGRVGCHRKRELTELWRKYLPRIVPPTRLAGRYISPGTPVSSSNKTDNHNATEFFLKVVLKKR